MLPCSAAKLLRAGVHENLARRMIEGLGVHGFDDGDVIRDLGEMREEFRKFCAGLAVPGKLKLWAEQGGLGLMNAAR